MSKKKHQRLRKKSAKRNRRLVGVMESLEARELLTCVPGGLDADDQICEAQAGTIYSAGDLIVGNIDPANDVDVFAVNLTAGQQVRFETDGQFDSYLRLFNTAGTQLTSGDNDDGPGLGARIDFTSPTTQTVFLGISGFPNSSYDPLDGSGTQNASNLGEDDEGAYQVLVSRMIDVTNLTDNVDAFVLTQFADMNEDGGYVDGATSHCTVASVPCHAVPGGTVDHLLLNPGPDGTISLREAIIATNLTPGHQTIRIVPAGQINIPLPPEAVLNGLDHRLDPELGSLKITDSLTISSNNPTGTTISADPSADEFFEYHPVLEANVSPDADFNLVLENLTITNGTATALPFLTREIHAGGGGVRVVAKDSLLKLQNSKVLNNEAIGSAGGGVGTDGFVVLEHGTTVSNNSTTGSGGYGGGVFGSGVGVRDSTVSNNYTDQEKAFGGGIAAPLGRVELANATIEGNSTRAQHSNGGGIFAHTILANDSTIENNYVDNDFSHGGGVYATGELIASGSTFENNSTRGGTAEIATIVCHIGVGLFKSLLSGGFGFGGGLSGPLGPGAIAREIASAAAISARSVFHEELKEFNILGIEPEQALIALTKTSGIRIGDILTVLGLDPCPSSRGTGGKGGGAFAARVQLDNTKFLNNYTGSPSRGNGADGGALFVTQMGDVKNSAFIGNETRASVSNGGAIAMGAGRISEVGTQVQTSFASASISSPTTLTTKLYLSDSVFHSNSTEGSSGSFGGAIFADELSEVHTQDSLFYKNSTKGASGDGGAIASGGTVNVIGSEFQGNFTEKTNAGGGAISGGRVSIQQSVFKSNETVNNDSGATGVDGGPGGAVNGNTVSVHDSLFVNNSAGGNSSGPNSEGDFFVSGGGAIFASENVTVVNSTFVANSAVGNEAYGGAIYTGTKGGSRIEDSTFYANTAEHKDSSGGAIASTAGSGVYGSLSLTNTTITGNFAGNNGGGVYSRSAPNNSLNDLIVAGAVVNGNIAGGAGDDVHTESLTTTRKSIVGNDSASDDLVKSSAKGNAFIFRDPISTYPIPVQFARSGEITLAGTLDDTSLQVGCNSLPQSVIDSLTNQGLQNVDCGTFFTSEAPLTLFVSDLLRPAKSTFFTVTTTLEYDDNSPLTTTLREAISFVDSSPVHSKVVISPSLAGQTMKLSGEDIEISSSMGIFGPDERATIDIHGEDRIFHFTNTSGGNLSLSNLTLMNGKTTGSLQKGGAIRFDSNGTLTLFNSEIRNSSTTGTQSDGGSIAAPFGGAVSLFYSSILGSETTGSVADGGAIAADTVTLSNSFISQAATRGDSSDGGAIAGSNVTLLFSQISSSSTTGNDAEGGAIEADTVSLNTSELSNNATHGNNSEGGAVKADTFTSTASRIAGNATHGDGSEGGAIYTTGYASLTGGHLTFNSTLGADSSGGAMHVGDFLTANGTSFVSNLTLGDNAPGGAIYSRLGSVLNASRLVRNTTSGTNSPGGAIYNYAAGGVGAPGGDVFLTKTILLRNETNGDNSPGGAIQSNDGAVFYGGNNIVANKTAGLNSGGGAVSASNISMGFSATVYQNRTTGDNSPGGAFTSGHIGVGDATFSENGTGGFGSPGGALHSTGELALRQSTVSRNSTGGSTSHGGGISGATVQLIQNTISGNSTLLGDGGGVYAANDLTMMNSIVLGNYSNTNSSHEIQLGFLGPVTLYGDSIVGETPMVFAPIHGCFVSGVLRNAVTGDPPTASTYCRPEIPDTAGIDQPDKHITGRTINDSPANVFADIESLKVDTNGDGKRDTVAGLQDSGAQRTNGSQLHTIALNPSLTNPAIDSSDGSSDGDPLVNDARGKDRFVDLSTPPPAPFPASSPLSLAGDLTEDGSVDFADFLVLTGNFGTTVSSYTEGDINGDGEVSFADFLTLSNNFGTTFGIRVTPVSGVKADLGTIELETRIPETDSLVVTTLADSVYEFDHETSLREAILFANSNLGADTITFDPSLSGGVITLVDHDADGLDIDLEITESLTIDGFTIADAITIDANEQSRVFRFTAATGTLTLNRLTLTNGLVEDENGGAVRFDSSGTLTLNENIVSNSSTQGVNSLGGGIYSNGPVNISNSAIYGNETEGEGAHGGGLFTNGLATISNSTFFENTVAGDQADGGGVHASTLTLTNSTLVGNASLFRASTGGGVYLGISGTVNNSILLGNMAGNGPDADTEIGGATEFAVSFGGHNIVGVDNDAFGVDGSTNVQNAPLLDVFTDGQLADNGGPIPTIELKPSTTSPALDAGVDSLTSETTDARGLSRKVNLSGLTGSDQVDLGAYELQAGIDELPNLTVTTNSDDVDATDFVTSLREAIIFANDPVTGLLADGDADNDGSANDTITFVEFPTATTIQLTGQLSISSSLTIDGLGADKLTISAAGTGQRIFDITDFAPTLQDVTINGLTLTGGGTTSAAHFGGAVLNREKLSLVDLVVSGNSGSLGGGIFNSGELSLGGSVVKNNTSSNNFGTGDGGGLELTTGSVTRISSSEIYGNTAAGNGGGINALGELTIEDSTLANNDAFHGGGLSLNTTNMLSVLNSTFSGNSALQHGGGLANFGGLASGSSIVSSTFTGNRGDSDGILDGPIAGQAGGIFDGPQALELHNSILAGNFKGTGTSPSDIESGLGAASHNIVGSAVTFIPPSLQHGTNGNMVGINGSGTKPTASIIDLVLADNGGRTRTHGLVGNSPAINSASIQPSFFQLADQRGVERLAPDIGAVELHSPNVNNVIVNNGEIQRSMVRKLTVEFNQEIVHAPGAFSLLNTTASAVTNTPFVVVTADITSSDNRVFELSFGGSTPLIGGSLEDGNYVLTIDRTKVSAASSGAQMEADHADNFFRFYGDLNADRGVDSLDFNQFRDTFFKSAGHPDFNDALDFNGDSGVDSLDFNAFRERFFKTLSP